VLYGVLPQKASELPEVECFKKDLSILLSKFGKPNIRFLAFLMPHEIKLYAVLHFKALKM